MLLALRLANRFKITLAVLLLIITPYAYAQDIIVSLHDGRCNAEFAGKNYSCSIGRHGITADKRDGDGKTPKGEFQLRRVLVRPDRIYRDNLRYVSLPVNYITPDDGWCDDNKDPQYNTQINLAILDPDISYEALFREDNQYDVLIVVGYNDAPVKTDLGSTIFIHVAQKKYAGTSGSIGLAAEDLMQILPQLNDNSKLIVKG